MRSAIWLALLVAITFGIGWTASRLAARDGASAAPAGVESISARGASGARGGAPFFGSVEDLADDLALDAPQRERLAQLLDDSTQRIRAHEVLIFDIKADTRRGMLELLTDAQRARLALVFEERMKSRQREHVEQSMEWFRAHTTLDAPALERVRAILDDYESAKRGFVRAFCEPAPAAAARPSVDELRAQRDARLAQVVDAESLEKYRTERSPRRKGGRNGRDRHLPEENRP